MRADKRLVNYKTLIRKNIRKSKDKKNYLLIFRRRNAV
jgi:hypothetical protein